MAIHRCPRCDKKFLKGSSITRHLGQPNSLCARMNRSPVHSVLHHETEEVLNNLKDNELEFDNIGDGRQ